MPTSVTPRRIGLVSEVHPATDLSAATEAEARRLATIPANQLALNKLLINHAYENMGLRTIQMLDTFFDGLARHPEQAVRWIEEITENGLSELIADRDRPWKTTGNHPVDDSELRILHQILSHAPTHRSQVCEVRSASCCMPSTASGSSASCF